MKAKVLKRARFYSSDRKKIYTATLFDTFSHCDCAGFQYRQNCRHVAWLKKPEDPKAVVTAKDIQNIFSLID